MGRYIVNSHEKFQMSGEKNGIKIVEFFLKETTTTIVYYKNLTKRVLIMGDKT